MAGPAAPRRIASTPEQNAARLTRWSLLMLAVFVVDYFATAIVGHWLLGALGLHEGDLLLMDRSVAGWVAEVGLSLVLVFPPFVGVLLAADAMRHGARWGARVSLVVNSLLVLVVVYTFFDAVRMTYFPS